MIQLIELPRTLVRKGLEYWRKLWVRVTLMGALAVVAMALTQPARWLLPQDLQTRLTGQAADRLLDIIAGAMLSVTIFSLTVMVTVFNNVSSQWTPRIHRLAMQDEVTLHTLATFIGAWVFALMGIVLRELGVFPDDSATVLFAVTVLVLIYMAFSLIRWVLHLQTFGSLLASTRQVEKITCDGLSQRFDAPCLGAHPFTGDPPPGTRTLTATQTGYVQTIYQEALDAFCADHGLELWLLAAPGAFVPRGAPLLAVRGEDKTLQDKLAEFIVQGDVRLHDQDPRFGLVVLSEIAAKALSPGINDPGTAVDVITRGVRILNLYRDETGAGDAPDYPRLHVRPLDPRDLIDDLFSPIAGYGSGDLTVQIHIQKALAALETHPDADLASAAADARLVCARRTLETLRFAPDRDRFAPHAPKAALGAA